MCAHSQTFVVSDVKLWLSFARTFFSAHLREFSHSLVMQLGECSYNLCQSRANLLLLFGAFARPPTSSIEIDTDLFRPYAAIICSSDVEYFLIQNYTQTYSLYVPSSNT
jgi:hypothetical protein